MRREPFTFARGFSGILVGQIKMSIFWKALNDPYCLKIEHDTDSPHPRHDNDNLGSMICWHNRYNLGDRHRFQTPRDFVESLAEEFEIKRIDEKSDQELFVQIEKHVQILPIYAYEHGGIMIRTNKFLCPWDSGQVGYIYVSKKQAREEYGKLTKINLELIENVLKAEIEEYNHYLQGEVYGFTLYSVMTDALRDYLLDAKMEIHDTTFDELLHFLVEMDSCWGFIGNDHVKNGLSEHLPMDARHLLNELKEGSITERRELCYA